MIPDLYRFVTENKEKIISGALSLANSEEARRRARELWVDYTPSQRAAGQAGIDSGWNFAAFHGFYFYAVDAVAVGLSGEEVGRRVDAGVSTMAVLNGNKVTYNPGLFLESIGMEFEKELAEEARVDLVLLDGSILARYYNRRRGVVENDVYGLVRDIIGRGNTIFIAKYSSSSSLFEGPVGDMYYLHHITSAAGFTRPRKIKDLDLAFTYARLSDHSPLIRIEMPGDFDESDVKGVLDMLSWRAIRGYPYVLLEAHRRCKVSNEEMATLISLAGLSYEEGAREVLWE